MKCILVISMSPEALILHRYQRKVYFKALYHHKILLNILTDSLQMMRLKRRILFSSQPRVIYSIPCHFTCVLPK